MSGAQTNLILYENTIELEGDVGITVGMVCFCERSEG